MWSTAFLEVLPAYLKLGLTSFGGPIAHLGYFRNEFVQRRRWIDDAAYADIVALCQFLPGPASSQVGMSLGLMRAGIPGALLAWLGFTMPSALLMILFGYGVSILAGLGGGAVLHGLMLVAAAVVAQAVWTMGQRLCPDLPRAALALGATLAALAMPGAGGQIAVILVGGAIGLMVRWPAERKAQPLPLPMNIAPSVIALAVFFALLVGLPILSSIAKNHALVLFDRFYRAGALVFGGGHVVLPLLQTAVTPDGWVSNENFLAGYGMAQAVPGPLFTFAAYLGAVQKLPPAGWLGGLLCLAAIFLPSLLLVIGALPFWSRWRNLRPVQAALTGINAAVVGLLAAALYNPVWVGTVFKPADAIMVAAAFVLLQVWRLPPWLVVILGAAADAAFEYGRQGLT